MSDFVSNLDRLGPCDGDFYLIGREVGRVRVLNDGPVTLYYHRLAENKIRPLDPHDPAFSFCSQNDILNFLVQFAREGRPHIDDPRISRTTLGYLHNLMNNEGAKWHLRNAPIGLPATAALVGVFFTVANITWSGDALLAEPVDASAMLALPKVQARIAYQWVFGTPFDEAVV